VKPLLPGQGVRGRGAALNPSGRFERLQVVWDDDGVDPSVFDESEGAGPAPALPTTYLRDESRTLIVTNDSPDIGFDASLNPYRGCAHGCTYCYARPYHEFLGLSAGLDFETKILVKENAPTLLRAALSKRGYVPKPLALSGVTDPYQPVERELGITRACVRILSDARHPLGIITKNHLVTRDIDLLRTLVPHRAVRVAVSITTLDARLARSMEPRASSPQMRLAAVRALHEAGIPTIVLVAPVIPGLTDHEIPAILDAAREAGASDVGWTLLRLPHGVESIFLDWLERHAPGRRPKVEALLRDLRGGALNDSRTGQRMRGTGAFAAHLEELLRKTRQRLGFTSPPPLSPTAFRAPHAPLPLFEWEEDRPA
jgi:DNA repair photolyase